jgi:Rod binding domain-containing protein
VLTQPANPSAAWSAIRDRAAFAPAGSTTAQATTDQPTPARTPPTSGLGARQAEFAAVLAKKTDRAGPSGTRESQARTAAEDFVAVAFIQPILKQLRESNTAEAPFAPGPAEKQFRGLMDGQFARRIVQAGNYPLVDRLARDMLKHGVQAPPAGADTAATALIDAARRTDVATTQPR